jgi:hypothetical protein
LFSSYAKFCREPLFFSTLIHLRALPPALPFPSHSLRLRSAPLARSFLSRRFGAHAAPAAPAASGEVSQAEKTATLLANLGGQGGSFVRLPIHLSRRFSLVALPAPSL